MIFAGALIRGRLVAGETKLSTFFPSLGIIAQSLRSHFSTGMPCSCVPGGFCCGGAMPTRIAGFCCFFLWLLFGASALAAPMRACSVLWPPHTTLAADGKTAGGLHTDIVLRVMRDAGFEMVVDVLSWERCLKDLADGYYAAAYAASFREERAKYAVYPEEAMDTMRYVAVVRAGEPSGWDARHDYASLPQPLAAPRGWAITEEIRTHGGLRIDDNSTHNDQDIRKLLAGRVGTAVVEFRAAQQLIKALDPDGRLRILDEPVVADRKYYIIFSRKGLGEEGARDVAGRFSAAIRRMAGASGMR